MTVKEIRQKLSDLDSTVEVFVAPTVEIEAAFPHNYRDDRGILCRVYGVRGAGEVRISHDLWVMPLQVLFGLNLCDGCKERLSMCSCGGEEDE
jgi:hypothetical protein